MDSAGMVYETGIYRDIIIQGHSGSWRLGTDSELKVTLMYRRNVQNVL